MNRPRLGILLSIGLVTSPLLGAGAGVSAPESIEPFFKTHCYDCHDADTAKADLNLEKLSRNIVDSADALNWQDILDKLNAGEMLPKKKKQPSKEELSEVVGDLTESLQAAQKMLRDSGGTIAIRRLNRREYEGTIKDLMGLQLNGEKLPDDPSGRFDTIGQNQSLSAIQLEKYFTFGQEIARTALEWAAKPSGESKLKRIELGPAKGHLEGRQFCEEQKFGSDSDIRYFADKRFPHRNQRIIATDQFNAPKHIRVEPIPETQYLSLPYPKKQPGSSVVQSQLRYYRHIAKLYRWMTINDIPLKPGQRLLFEFNSPTERTPIRACLPISR
jgi:hypothetical protein